MPLSNGGKTFPRKPRQAWNCCLISNLPSASRLANHCRFNRLDIHEPNVTSVRTFDDVAEGLRLRTAPSGIGPPAFKLLILKGIETNLKSDLAIRRKAPMAVACLTGMPC